MSHYANMPCGRSGVRIFEANQLSGEISPESENLIIILTPTAMTAGSPVTFGPAKPVILRSEPEVRTEDACHRAERGLFLTAACKMVVSKAGGDTAVILESVAIG